MGVSISRRLVLRLLGVVAIGCGAGAVLAKLIEIFPDSTDLAPEALPDPGRGGFLTDAERRTVGAIFDRMIPEDELSPSATQCGCVDFLDRQVSGPFGNASALYMSGPFLPGTPEQGWQRPETPAQRYRQGLSAIDVAAQARHRRDFASLSTDLQDAFLRDLEQGAVKLSWGIDGQALFELMLANVREGFLADPMYGGNKDMAGWRMIGFPGARYDYRDVVDKRGARLDIPPVSLLDPARAA